MLLNSLLRRVGVGIFVFTLTTGVASAMHESQGQIGNGGKGEKSYGQNHYDPPYGGGYTNPPSFGGCNSAGTFCWNIQLPPTPPSQPYYTYPIEVYGDEAKTIVERGHIIDRRFGWGGWRYLVKTGWQSWFQFKNKTFDCSVSHQDPKEYFCEEWTPQERW